MRKDKKGVPKMAPLFSHLRETEYYLMTVEVAPAGLMGTVFIVSVSGNNPAPMDFFIRALLASLVGLSAKPAGEFIKDKKQNS